MNSTVKTVSFSGLFANDVLVQVHISTGLPSITIVGLASKSVAESKERVRAALSNMGLALPPKRISVNLSPAGMIKEGAHFDLLIALAIMIAMGALPQEYLDETIILGELSLDGSILSVSGVLLAAMSASEKDMCLICPESNGAEAVWANELKIIAAPTLHALCNHLRGILPLNYLVAKLSEPEKQKSDMADIKGQETAKRALEIAAVGGHNLLMIGPPGAGKSMLAERMKSILPELSAAEALSITMIHSINGTLPEQGLISNRPFRDPHHSASMASLIGGGQKSKPGEVSLAHNGVLFLDELPEFQRSALDSLRQPLETGEVVIARANQTIRYPASFQLIAAINPCRCGFLSDPNRACSRAPDCAVQYQNRISGPMLDRFDMIIFLGSLSASELLSLETGETSAQIRTRVKNARAQQSSKHRKQAQLNAKLSADFDFELTDEANELLHKSIDKFALTARGFHNILRVATSIQNLENKDVLYPHHLAEALSYRIQSIRT
jgi:magnesium chelatase family protein